MATFGKEYAIFFRAKSFSKNFKKSKILYPAFLALIFIFMTDLKKLLKMFSSKNNSYNFLITKFWTKRF